MPDSAVKSEFPMNKLMHRLAVTAFAIIALLMCGCPALMIPGLAYSGYQYEKTGQIPGMPSSSASPSGSSSEKKASPQRTPAPDEIE